jgi:subtilisin family serine protease
MWTNPVDGSHGLNTIATNNLPMDDSGHGTLVAGVLGAVGNNGKGVVGVAWRVQIMACKCFTSTNTGSDSDIITCLDYARTNGARIVNASWGGYSYSAALSNAFLSLHDAGIIVVAAAGNDFKSIDVHPYYPACFALDNIVSVAYINRTNMLGLYSNYGATNVDLAAPGDQIYSTFFLSDSSYLGGPLSGTSFAAPYVSGAFALMLVKYPSETYQQIISRVLAATDPVPALAGKCVTGGRLNLRKALSLPLVLSVTSGGGLAPFQLHLSAGPRRTCVIQTSADLISWTPVVTNTTSSSGSFDFTDYSATNLILRYYRAMAPL